MRTALYEYLIAKVGGGDFVLRIEDTDQKREVDNGIEGIVKDLNDFLGILWKLGIRYSNIDELRTELSKFNFDIDDYPNVKQYIENDLNDDDIIWSEKTIK